MKDGRFCGGKGRGGESCSGCKVKSAMNTLAPTRHAQSMRHMDTKEFHPVSSIFPLMTGASFDELVADIKANGLREPIWIHQYKIIDGRNRYNACLKAEVEPQYREWEGNGDLTKFVISLNLHRRHLNSSQRGIIAAKLAIRKHGSNPKWDAIKEHDESIDSSIPTPTRSEAAEMLNVGSATVQRARRVLRDGIPEVVASIEAGEMSLNAAQEIVSEPRERQTEALAEKKSPKRDKVVKNWKSNGASPLTRTNKGRKPLNAIRGAVGTLVGLATGLDAFTVKSAEPTPDEAKQWERDLLKVITSVNRFLRQIREHSNAEA